jgi:hypothetical protein
LFASHHFSTRRALRPSLVSISAGQPGVVLLTSDSRRLERADKASGEASAVLTSGGAAGAC